ncbi:threonine-phosphate decarboxylase [uncultured Jannaschia sp.]|uniref:threonine-phosphate decarboxylase n=1 Tax=uncultured Jannaschia sp. TaxID=293347 RepID=UPI0026048E1D|nr:threonine-phosphate decarboxylase [uncultured Jannaschia sp.]
MSPDLDHGGGLDAARARFGGGAEAWLDLSTGINPEPYPIPHLSARAWATLPDRNAQAALRAAARQAWSVPDGAEILAAPGVSALIPRLPYLAPRGRVAIPGPTYNEHEAAFRMAGWTVTAAGGEAIVIVHPNNPDGRLHSETDADAPLAIIDESFCDVTPDASLIRLAERPGTVVLKSFGKFWGLAGLRLGFAIARPETIARLADALGPWPVAGPALAIGTAALGDADWADRTRARLARDAARLDALMAPHGTCLGGTTLFRLYALPDASAFQSRLAHHRIWSRTFPYSDIWLRLGLPPAEGWPRLEAVLA